MGDLYRKLKTKKDQNPGKNLGQGRVLVQASHGNSLDLDGWIPLAPLVWQKTTTLHPSKDFEKKFTLAKTAGLFCLDTETTGLSSGAGTLAFLIGWCSYREEENKLEVRQFFLQDFGGETEYLKLIEHQLSFCRELRTFNGSSYDLPLLKSRWALQGREFPPLPHKDLLHPARRMWKNLLGSCQLKNLEKNILGIFREGDVSGEEVPQLYFQYLLSGAGEDFSKTLSGIFQHHFQDVLSLWYLEVILEKVQTDPRSVLWEYHSRKFLCRKSPPESFPVLAPHCIFPLPLDPRNLLQLSKKDETLDLTRDQWTRTREEFWGLVYTEFLSKSSPVLAWDIRMEISQILSFLWREKKSIKALIRLVKFLEHREKNPLALRQARNLTAEALKDIYLSQGIRKDLEKRKHRLDSKLETGT